MNPADYKEKTIYLRQRGDTWECMAKVDGKGMMLQNLPTRALALQVMNAYVWALDTYGIEKYGTVLSEMETMKAPEGVEYPVVEEAPIP